MNVGARDVFDIVVPDHMVLANHPDSVLGSQGGSQGDVRATEGTGPKDKVSFDRGTVPGSHADAALAFEERVVENFVVLGFDGDDFRFAA